MENSYLSAITSHTSYWSNQDVALFLITALYPDAKPLGTTSSNATSSTSSTSAGGGGGGGAGGGAGGTGGELPTVKE